MFKTRLVKIIAGFLGSALFLFGILKFVDPFKGWYQVQISKSELPSAAIWMGLTAEIVVGSTLILSLIFYKKLAGARFRRIMYGCSATVIFIMAVASYVHWQPLVPADVLPMKIKPPFLPLSFALLAILLASLTTQLANDPTKK